MNIQRPSDVNINSHLPVINRHSEHTLPKKLHYKIRKIEPLKKYDLLRIQAPTIYGADRILDEQPMYKLLPNKIKIDRNKHLGNIICASYNKIDKTLYGLQSMSDEITLFSEQCDVIGHFRPTKMSSSKAESGFISFTYSSRQNRIGATFKDFTLVFWDISRNKITSEKRFPITTWCSEYQSGIWFLEQQSIWVTSDRRGNVYTWNLLEEKPDLQITLSKKSRASDVCEIPTLCLTAIVQETVINQNDHNLKNARSSNYSKVSIMKNETSGNDEDKSALNDSSTTPLNSISDSNTKIYLYNLRKGCKVGVVDTLIRGLHTLRYSPQFEILLAAGYDTKIDTFEINPIYFDAIGKGRLIGHERLVVTFELVENTSLLVSADDGSFIKVWNLATFKCLQTISFSEKTVIYRLINMIEQKKLAVLGTRLNIVPIDSTGQIQKQGMKSLQVLSSSSTVLGVHYSPEQQEIFIFNKYSVKVYDAKKGTVKHIFSGFFTENTEEKNTTCDTIKEHFESSITICYYISSKRKFIIGNELGELQIYSILNGEYISSMIPHRACVTSIHYDFHNDLFVTASEDSDIILQQEKPGTNTFDEIRRLTANFFNGPITIMCTNVYHGIIAVGSVGNPTVHMWEYESGKLMKGIKLPQSREPTDIKITDVYGVMIVSDNQGCVFLFKVWRIGSIQEELKIELIHQLTVRPEQSLQRSTDAALSEFVTVLVVQSKVPIQASSPLLGSAGKCRIMMMMGTSEGRVIEVDLMPVISEHSIQSSSAQYKRQNYNPMRRFKESFVNQIKKKERFKDYSYDIEQEMNKKSQHHATICLTRGKTNEEYAEIIYQAHFRRASVVKIGIIDCDNRYRVTIGSENRLKIWTPDGQLVCDSSLNLPLPYKWDINLLSENIELDKLTYALKVSKLIMKKYSNTISINEYHQLEINKMLREMVENIENLSPILRSQLNLSDGLEPQTPCGSFFETIPHSLDRQSDLRRAQQNIATSSNQMGIKEVINRPCLIQQEYTQKDLNYDKVLKSNPSSVAGPRIKWMEQEKYIRNFGRDLKEKEIREEQQRESFLRELANRNNKYEEKEQLLSFLLPNKYTCHSVPESGSKIGSEASMFAADTPKNLPTTSTPLNSRPSTTNTAFKAIESDTLEGKFKENDLQKGNFSLKNSLIRKINSQLELAKEKEPSLSRHKPKILRQDSAEMFASRGGPNLKKTKKKESFEEYYFSKRHGETAATLKNELQGRLKEKRFNKILKEMNGQLAKSRYSIDENSPNGRWSRLNSSKSKKAFLEIFRSQESLHQKQQEI